MKIYLSGLVGSGIEGESQLMASIPADKRFRCFTFYYLYPALMQKKTDNRYLKTFEWAIKNKVRIMLDSGAHTVQKLYGERGGKGLDNKNKSLEQFTEELFLAYIDFCQTIKTQVDFYVTFDYVSNVKETWRMTERMHKAGLKPVPVFHGDESPDWLLKYAQAGYDYLGISGIATTDKGRFKRLYSLEYLDSCFDLICNSEGKPRYKTHGFAATALEVMSYFPWTSVDSSTWLQCAAYGKIVFFDTVQKRLLLISVSKQKVDALNYWSLSASGKKLYDKVFERAGTNIRELSQEKTAGLTARMLFNAKVFANSDFSSSVYVPRFEKLF